jgi:hypothetical protein
MMSNVDSHSNSNKDGPPLQQPEIVVADHLMSHSLGASGGGVFGSAGSSFKKEVMLKKLL